MTDFTAQMLTEIRDEAREARAQKRENCMTVFHTLSLVKASMNVVMQRLTSSGGPCRRNRARHTQAVMD